MQGEAALVEGDAIGQALLNHQVGHEVTVRVPAGLLRLRIESITLA